MRLYQAQAAQEVSAYLVVLLSYAFLTLHTDEVVVHVQCGALVACFMLQSFKGLTNYLGTTVSQSFAASMAALSTGTIVGLRAVLRVTRKPSCFEEYGRMLLCVTCQESLQYLVTRLLQHPKPMAQLRSKHLEMICITALRLQGICLSLMFTRWRIEHSWQVVRRCKPFPTQSADNMQFTRICSY